MVILEDDGGKTCRLKLRKPHPHCFGTLIFPVSKMRVKTVSLLIPCHAVHVFFYLHCLPDAAAFVWTVTARTPEVGELRLKLVTLDQSRMSASVKWNTWGTHPSAAALGAVLAGAVLCLHQECHLPVLLWPSWCLYCSLFQRSCPWTCMALHLPQSCPQHQFWLLSSV